MKVIRNRIIPFGNYFAINLFGIIFAKGECDSRMLNHEYIHTLQMRDMLYIPFYIWYVLEWAVRLIQYGDARQSYLNISFEREAYRHGNDLTYPGRRRRFAFLKYLRQQ